MTFVLKEAQFVMAEFGVNIDRASTVNNVLQELIQRLSDVEARSSMEFMWRPIDDERRRSRSVSVTDLGKMQMIAEGTRYPQAEEDDAARRARRGHILETAWYLK